MRVLNKDLGNQEEHTFLEVEGPNVYCASMFYIIIEFFLRLQDGQEMTERVSMLDQVNKSSRFEFVIFPLAGPRKKHSIRLKTT